MFFQFRLLILSIRKVNIFLETLFPCLKNPFQIKIRFASSKNLFHNVKYDPTPTTRENTMNSPEFNELAGRMQGIADTLLLLISTLDQAEIIYAPDFGVRVASLATTRALPEHLDSARHTMRTLAEQIERNHDLLQAHRAETAQPVAR
jgi:hypothetical protein